MSIDWCGERPFGHLASHHKPGINFQKTSYHPIVCKKKLYYVKKKQFMFHTLGFKIKSLIIFTKKKFLDTLNYCLIFIKVYL